MLRNNVLAAALGVLAHQVVFIHGEWHLRAPAVVIVHLLIGIFIYTTEISKDEQNGLLSATVLVCLYLASLLSSISIYRLFFHPLRHFPGPRLVALTKLWHVWKCRDSRGHHVLDEWHKKYGTFVRTGPAEITIFHPVAYQAMDGPGNQNTRSDWYDLLYPRISSIFTRDRKLHSSRRKLWERALSRKALMEYYERVREKVHTLENLVMSQNSRPVDINKLMYWFAFDSMGDFAFSEDFGMMKNKAWHQNIVMLRSALALLGPLSPAIWIPRLGFAFIPGLWRVRDWFQMLAFCDKCMERRMKRKVESKDIASWFIEDHLTREHDSNRHRWLSGDTATLVVAGSDTTAPSLSILFYFLARYPEHVEKINLEIMSVDHEDPNALAALPHLNGTINEAMRLLPAVLTFSSRVTPPEGITVENTFIPGNTKICAPRYTIGRLECAYEQPNDFIPERWYSRPELIKDRRAFAPFGVGHTSCVGKHLAIAQIRLVAANLISRYRIEFAPGEGSGEAVERDMKDQLTARPGRFHLIFVPRGMDTLPVGNEESKGLVQ
ncbi:hypothetical protein DTO212C5_8476 [Paecilomyces variotii]|nr:hypothetical protein DTO212C5_8476 [Paecilomyces variotii]